MIEEMPEDRMKKKHERLQSRIEELEARNAHLERKQKAAQNRLYQLEQLESLNQVIHNETHLEAGLQKILETVKNIFQSDRAWLLYPCDPEAESWHVPMEVSDPDYPGAFLMNKKVDMTQDVRKSFTEILAADGPVTYAIEPGQPLWDPDDTFTVRSTLCMALYPKTGKPWDFGLHQCAYQRKWTKEEKKLFTAIGLRITDALSNMLLLKSIAESEERFELAMEFTHDGLFDWDLKTDTIYYSPGWKKMIGYENDEIKNKLSEWRRLLRPIDVETSCDMLNEILEGKKERFEKEIQMLHKNGHWVDILSRANIIFDEKGEGIRVVGTHVDITERKNAERELLQQKKISERYLNLAGVMFVGLDAHGNINIANKKACEILECREQDVIGENWFENFLPVPARFKAQSLFNQMVDGKIKPDQYCENQIISKSGELKHITWHSTLIKDEDDNIVGVLGSGEDITEKIKLEAQLQHAQKMESIGNLAGGIAHDFNNILYPIIGMSELLLDDLPKKSLEYDNTKEILKAGKRGSELVKQILAFSRQSKQKKTPVRVQHILKEAIKFSRSIIPADIEISHDIQINCGLVMADPTLIHQIIMNLLTNAYHAVAENGGTLSIVLKEEILRKKDPTGKPLQPRKHACLKISDTGYGIAPDIMDKIFDPYFTTKEMGEGTGLGLAVVYGIIKEFDGDILIESQVENGTTVTVYFPILMHSAQTATAEKKIQPQKGNEKVLLVDDEKAIVKLESKMFERLGYHVTSYTDSMNALEAFQSDPEAFDIVITDMAMPRMSGDQLAKRLISIKPDLPIILCTGYSERIDSKKASAIGIKGFLMKPVAQSNIAQVVREVLDEADN